MVAVATAGLVSLFMGGLAINGLLSLTRNDKV